MSIVLTFRPRWYRRAWAWFKRVVLRRRPPPPRWLTVVGVDREAGSITVEGLR
jgi:hypothetical protein